MPLKRPSLRVLAKLAAVQARLRISANRSSYVPGPTWLAVCLPSMGAILASVEPKNWRNSDFF